MNVYVVFVNEVDDPNLFFLHWLAPGFRHCFLVVSSDENHWVIIDHLYPFTLLKVLTKKEIDEKIKYWIDQGYIIINTQIQDSYKNSMNFGIQTCVETTKRILKINNWFIFTPHQLFQFLMKNYTCKILKKEV